MKHPCTLLMLALALGGLAVAQQTPSATKAKPAPSGTIVTKRHMNTELQPTTKQVGVTPGIIRAAQEKLNLSGYKAGNATGKMNLSTRRAIRAFQAHEKQTATGRTNSTRTRAPHNQTANQEA